MSLRTKTNIRALKTQIRRPHEHIRNCDSLRMVDCGRILVVVELPSIQGTRSTVFLGERYVQERREFGMPKSEGQSSCFEFTNSPTSSQSSIGSAPLNAGKG